MRPESGVEALEEQDCSTGTGATGTGRPDDAEELTLPGPPPNCISIG